MLSRELVTALTEARRALSRDVWERLVAQIGGSQGTPTPISIIGRHRRPAQPRCRMDSVGGVPQKHQCDVERNRNRNDNGGVSCGRQ